MAKTALELGTEGWKKYLGKTKPRPKLAQPKRLSARARNQTPRAAVARKPSDGTIHAAKTALELGPEGWKEYFGKPKNRLRLAQKRKLVARATRQARRAAELLKREFGATRVVLIGTLADKALFTRWSDIDLVASGIARDEYSRAETALANLRSGFKIDLVDLGYFRRSYRKKVLKDAIELK